MRVKIVMKIYTYNVAMFATAMRLYLRKLSVGPCAMYSFGLAVWAIFIGTEIYGSCGCIVLISRVSVSAAW